MSGRFAKAVKKIGVKNGKRNAGRVFGRILLFAVGLLLMLYGALYPLLSVIGETAAGRITVVRRVLGERDEPLPNRFSYSVGYEFRTADGDTIHGNTKRIGSAYSAGIAKGPVTVRYLAVFPYVNALEEDAAFDAGKAAILAAGALLCMLAFIRKKRPRENP